MEAKNALPESPLHSEELGRINRNYQLSQDLLNSQGKKTLFGRCARSLRKLLFGTYYDVQSEFQGDLVRVLNRLSSLEDARLWRLDDEQRGTLLAMERELRESLQREKDSLLGTISGLEARVTSQGEQLQMMDSVTKGLERILATLGAAREESSQSLPKPDEEVAANRENTKIKDYRYVLLENRYRGSEEQISKRLSVYLEYFVGEESPVLEIGSGRGEFLELLREKNVPSYGLEIDPAMQELCLKKDLDVRLEDGVQHLNACTDSSLGGLIAVQVVEHLDVKTLESLLQLAAKKVRSGGTIIFETINTKSLLALCQNYFRDPTHAQPLHPQTMAFMAEMAGLKVKEIRELSPYPAEATLQGIPIRDYMSPSARETAELINHNFTTLNSILFGFQDYSVVATPDC